MKIIFYGTPEFAVPSLAILFNNGYDIVAVVTAPDKPAGRGQKLNVSAIKQFAIDNGIKVLQPLKLADPHFVEEIRSLNADLQIVVAFRMMPEVIWAMPPLGTFNLHGSLLPDYRGAAPINRAVMNGEPKTGVTTFFLKQQIDTGNIIFQEELSIGPDETAGELHDRMMLSGADLVLKTVKYIESGNVVSTAQDKLISNEKEIKHAPKIFRDDCNLDFSKTIAELHNQVRGLSPYPGAFFEIKQPDGAIMAVKVFKSKPETAGTVLTHELLTDEKTFIKVSAADGFLYLLELQLPGKKRMTAQELLRGFHFSPDSQVL
jgi:methionyl-tRNA formyltransferase